jgi:hypothetical protein
MFTTFKRFAVVVLVPAVVGLGVWAEWTTLTTKFAMLGTSAAESIESIPADLTTDGVQPDARATVPEIKPAPAPDRKPENGAAEQAPPQAAKITAEPAQVDPAARTRPAPAAAVAPAAPAAPKVKRLPFAIERRPEDGAAAQARVSAPATKIDVQPAQATAAPQPKPEFVKPAAAAEQQPAQKIAIKESEAAKPQAQDKPTPKSEAKSEVKPAAAAEQRSAQKTATKESEAAKPQAQDKPTPKSEAKSEVKPEVKPAAAAEQRSAQKTATKESEAAKPQAQDKPTPKSEAKSEVKPEAKSEAKSEAKPDDRAARKENAAKREKAEQAAQSRNGRSASRERPSRSYDPDDVDPRKALTELRRSRSVADFYDRLEALWGMR